MKVSDFHITHLSHVCISKEDSKQEHREELLATCKKSYKQVNQVLGITEHHPLEKELQANHPKTDQNSLKF